MAITKKQQDFAKRHTGFEEEKSRFAQKARKVFEDTKNKVARDIASVSNLELQNEINNLISALEKDQNNPYYQDIKDLEKLIKILSKKNNNTLISYKTLNELHFFKILENIRKKSEFNNNILEKVSIIENTFINITKSLKKSVSIYVQEDSAIKSKESAYVQTRISFSSALTSFAVPVIIGLVVNFIITGGIVLTIPALITALCTVVTSAAIGLMIALYKITYIDPKTQASALIRTNHSKLNQYNNDIFNNSTIEYLESRLNKNDYSTKKTQEWKLIRFIEANNQNDDGLFRRILEYFAKKYKIDQYISYDNQELFELIKLNPKYNELSLVLQENYLENYLTTSWDNNKKIQSELLERYKKEQSTDTNKKSETIYYNRFRIYSGNLERNTSDQSSEEMQVINKQKALQNLTRKVVNYTAEALRENSNKQFTTNRKKVLKKYREQCIKDITASPSASI